MMEHQQNTIPDNIFDWINKRPFRSLTDDEQIDVLTHLSEETYDEFYHTARMIQLSRETGYTLRQKNLKSDILNHFDHLQTHSAKPGIHILWKIAAVFFLFAAGWLCHYLTGHQKNNASIVATTDTVYITQKADIEPVYIFDTIYIETEQSGKQSKAPGRDLHDKMKEKRDATEFTPQHIHVAPNKTLDSSPEIDFNKRRDDSLTKS